MRFEEVAGDGHWRMGEPRPHRSRRILVDGREGVEGRALLAISALHLSADALRDHVIEVLFADDPVVELAGAALAYDEGLSLSCFTTDQSPSRWEGAALYISVRFRSPDQEALVQAHAHGVACLLALQFPTVGVVGSEVMRRTRAAHDPVLLARMITTAISPRGDDAV